MNKFRQSSCGVLFFNTPAVPEGFRVQCINGFVEKLVVNDDPEYQWIDKIRTPRASNEARQSLFMKLSSKNYADIHEIDISGIIFQKVLFNVKLD